MALLNLSLSILILIIQISLGFLGLGQLNLDIPEGVLEFLILNFTESQHLSVFDFCAFLAFHSQSLASHSLNLVTQVQWGKKSSQCLGGVT